MLSPQNHTAACRGFAEPGARQWVGSDVCAVVSPSGTISVPGSRTHSRARSSEGVGADGTVIAVMRTGAECVGGSLFFHNDHLPVPTRSCWKTGMAEDTRSRVRQTAHTLAGQHALFSAQPPTRICRLERRPNSAGFSESGLHCPPSRGDGFPWKGGLTPGPWGADRTLLTWLKAGTDQHRSIVAEPALSPLLEIRHPNFCRVEPKNQVGSHIRQRPSIRCATAGDAESRVDAGLQKQI